jgi:PAS domain S-box-containing protein
VESKALNIDELPGPTLVARPDGSILQANSHAERLFGLEPGSMVSLEFHQLIQEEHREEWLQRLESISGERPESRVKYGHVRCVTGDGHELTIDIDAGATADGSIAILIRDVTAEQRTEAERREEEERFRFGALHITDVVQYVDLLAGSLDWYGDLEAQLGYEPGTFPHTLSGWLELIHPDDIERIGREYGGFLASGSPTWEFRYRLKSGSGGYRHLRDRGSFVSYVDGKGVQGVGGIMDETEHVVARQELEAALAEVAALKDRLQEESNYLQSEIASSRGFDEDTVGHSITRGNRNREGAAGPRHSPAQPPQRPSAHQGRLRHAASGARRERALRSREGLVHGRPRSEDRTLRARARGDDSAGRDR